MTAPARFWPRYVAWSLDAALICVAIAPFVAARVRAAASAFDDHLLQLLIGGYTHLDRGLNEGLPALALTPRLVADPQIRATTLALAADLVRMGLPVLVGYVVAGLVYQVAAESTGWRATPGKRVLGLEVVDGQGRALGPLRALARYLASALSWLSLNLGHMMAMAPPHHLALHDRVSATRVRARSPERPLPRWALGWVLLQVLLGVVVCVALVVAFSRLALQALEAALGPIG
ncbi:hypothetical protein FKV24_001850 [Lysobacter maris]|uniref:Uncharacterized protein n=1 Tax=Marilutibacter maris TaxID=1605891 RepID=A0A508B5T0_9GAMM|nr:RDD family protein [Lysobacter maris]KAB8198479.1 hypothetical protein FKV24_001850 [Lysobacter maris]